jgi:hypothetical protein
MLLVVADSELVGDLNQVPWERLEGVMIVNTGMKYHYGTKERLKVMCRKHFIPLTVRFCIPEFEAPPPRELLLGNGLIVSNEVILYGDIIRQHSGAENNQQTDHRGVQEVAQLPSRSNAESDR